MNKSHLRLATRASPLALVQANAIKQQLITNHPELTITLIPMTTQGDQHQNTSLQDLGGKSLFVKTLQDAILREEADFAVHCIKDMSVFPCDGLTLSAISERAPANDVLISSSFRSLGELPKNAIIGTASPRRHCQIKAFRPDCTVTLCRGNINTRLNQLHTNQYDAIILAHAGLLRLGITQPHIIPLPLESFIPAIGQGALGMECRTQDTQTQKYLSSLHHPNTAVCVNTERFINTQLNGDCHTPIGIHAALDNNTLHIHAMIGDINSNIRLQTSQSGPQDNATQLAETVSKTLIDLGALDLIHKHRQNNQKG
ncbi:MAG: hydroxymethylbilane synthase [Legionellales bacterium]|nr:hydroxymethylbilane synthase [Legionellales bacterium]HAG61418.1 hydroxymethylbilane synthase [Coxiellaceae bacterium]